jgi:5,10-methylenetetrahydromethanopterin reductase
MLQSEGWAPRRPIEVPILVAPAGPKGYRVARELGVPGVVVPALPRPEDRDPGWQYCALLMSGTVLRAGEDHHTLRVADAVGPHYTTGVHGMWEFAPEAVTSVPGGQEWLDRIGSERPDDERHLVVHEGHLTVVTDRDRPLLDSAGAALLRTGWTGDAAAIHRRLDEAERTGVTELMYMPAGPNIGEELEAMAEVTGERP